MKIRPGSVVSLDGPRIPQFQKSLGIAGESVEAKDRVGVAVDKALVIDSGVITISARSTGDH